LGLFFLRKQIALDLYASAESYSWMVPADLAPANDYYVEISSYVPGAETQYRDTSAGLFSIASTAVNITPTSVTVLSPNGGEKYEIGKTYDISFPPIRLRTEFRITLTDSHHATAEKIITAYPSAWKDKLRAVFKAGRGRNVARFIRERLNPVLRGWFNYFVIGASNQAVATLDFWVRRRLRDLIWRQWKRPRTRMHRLMGLGVARLKACEALNRRGPWWNAGSPVVTQGLSPTHFQQLGLFCLTDTFTTWRRIST